MSIRTSEEKCAHCAKKFILRIDELADQEQGNNFKPLCPECRALKRRQAEEKRNREESELQRKKSEADRKEFLKRLNTWRVIPIDEVRPEDENTLYIIGNGFDLMHRVPSSYYNFRDTLGKHSPLRFVFENFITVDDMWADLENALAHFNIPAMTNGHVVDMWLDNFGVYDEDSGAAEYYMAVEAAANPIITVANELPYRFRKWVNTLTIGTAERPLSHMFINGKVLNFNYTEFVEDMYGVSKENVCYIHGCRVKQKGKPREPLILGHLLGASDASYDVEPPDNKCLRGFRRAYVEMAQSNVLDCITGYDEELTKDTEKIIEAHKQFFSGLSHIRTVIVIGHSFSETDWDYFIKVRANVNKAKWYFGCYGLHDLENLENLLPEIELSKTSVEIFRTDTISTSPSVAKKQRAQKPPAVKLQCASQNGRWSVESIRNRLSVKNSADNTDYTITLPEGFKRAFFVCNDLCILIVLYGLEPGVLLLRNIGEHWQFIGELYCDHQSLLVSRLKKVFVTDGDITFVYNNRIRKYSLVDGSCLCNKRIMGARNLRYDGKDITEKFSR